MNSRVPRTMPKNNIIPCDFPARKATISPGGLEAMLHNHAFSLGNTAVSENAPTSSSGAGLRNRQKT